MPGFALAPVPAPIANPATSSLCLAHTRELAGERKVFSSNPHAYCTDFGSQKYKFVRLAGRTYDVRDPANHVLADVAKRIAAVEHAMQFDLNGGGERRELLERESVELEIPQAVLDALEAGTLKPQPTGRECLSRFGHWACRMGSTVLRRAIDTSRRVLQEAATVTLSQSDNDEYGTGVVGGDFDGNNGPDLYALGDTDTSGNGNGTIYYECILGAESPCGGTPTTKILRVTGFKGAGFTDMSEDGSDDIISCTPAGPESTCGIRYGGQASPTIDILGGAPWPATSLLIGPTPTLLLAKTHVGSIGSHVTALGMQDANQTYVTFSKSGGVGSAIRLDMMTPDQGFTITNTDPLLSFAPTVGGVTYGVTGPRGMGSGDIDGDSQLDLLVRLIGGDGLIALLHGTASGFPDNVTLPNPSGLRYSLFRGSAGSEVLDVQATRDVDMNLDGFDDFLAMVEDGYVLVYGQSGGYPADNVLSSLEGATKITLPAGLTRGGPSIMFKVGATSGIVIQKPNLGSDGWASVVIWPQAGGFGPSMELDQMGFKVISNDTADLSLVVDVMELYVGGQPGLYLVRGAPNANRRSGARSQGAVYLVPFGALPSQDDSAASGIGSVLSWALSRGVG